MSVLSHPGLAIDQIAMAVAKRHGTRRSGRVGRGARGGGGATAPLPVLCGGQLRGEVVIWAVGQLPLLFELQGGVLGLVLALGRDERHRHVGRELARLLLVQGHRDRFTLLGGLCRGCAARSGLHALTTDLHFALRWDVDLQGGGPLLYFLC
jgi:hypothetical protein